MMGVDGSNRTARPGYAAVRKAAWNPVPERDARMRDGGNEGARGHVHAARDCTWRRDHVAGGHARRLRDFVKSGRWRDDHDYRVEDELPWPSHGRDDGARGVRRDTSGPAH